MATAKKSPPHIFTTVLLVRHGQTPTTGKVLPGRAKGLHLADEGRRQADVAAERIGELKRVDAIYSSPLERAKETAAPIAKARSLKTMIDRGLFECDFGDWTGATEIYTLSLHDALPICSNATSAIGPAPSSRS